jgi:glyoxylase I family protein
MSGGSKFKKGRNKMLDIVKTHANSTDATASRIHHSSWVVTDQERTRHFYEDLIGFPLAAFWIEDVPFEGKTLVMSHAFYTLPDNSALTFFNFADAAGHERFKSPKTEMFNHVAFKLTAESLDALIARLEGAGFHCMIIDHGYCRSMYTIDPDGLRLEFAVDCPRIDEVTAEQTATAHQTMKEWIAGRRHTNNHGRTEANAH